VNDLRRLVVETERYGNDDVDTEEPTAADIVAWMRDNPARAVGAIRAAKIAGPWEQVSSNHWCRRFPWRTGVAVVAVMKTAGKWRWWRCDGETRVDHRGRVVAERFPGGQDEADAELRAAGWSLA
jgi:hypothetical protein